MICNDSFAQWQPPVFTCGTTTNQVNICYKHYHSSGLSVANATASWGAVTTTQITQFNNTWTVIEGPMIITPAMLGQTITLTLTVTMSDNSQQTFTSTIAIPTDALVNAPTVNVTDLNCNGIATATLNGGSVVNFWWSNGAAPNPATYAQPGPGFVAVQYTCVGTPQFTVLNFNVNNFTPITATENVTGVLACDQGSINGTITLDISGGQAPYSVDWTPLTAAGAEGAEENLFIATTAGTVGYTITDANQCASSLTTSVGSGDFGSPISLNPNNILTATFADAPPSSFNIVCPGAIGIDNSSSMDFNYSLTPSNPGTSFDADNSIFENINFQGASELFTVTGALIDPLSNGCEVAHQTTLFRLAWFNDVYDLNGDGIVGFADLTMFLASYNTSCGSPCAADFNFDGVVGYSDLILFLAAYNTSVTCP